MWNAAAGDFMESDTNIEEDSESAIDNMMEHEEEMVKSEVDSVEKDAANITRSFHFLDKRSSIEHMDADGDFFVTSQTNGSDRDIRVWDAETQECVLLLKGHIGAITGLEFQEPSSFQTNTGEHLVVSSSEDGTIRRWSIPKGEEIGCITTSNTISCMGLLSRNLLVTGTNKGYLEIYHLLTGQLYTSNTVQMASIDALLVRDNHICTLMHGIQGNLKVWILHWGKLILLYNIEEFLKMDIYSFTFHNQEIGIGDTKAQQLHFLSIERPKNRTKLLCEGPGQVTAMDVTENLVFATTVDENNLVYLHVYQVQDFDHLFTYHCKNMEWVSRIIMLRSETALKFLLGGSGLAVLELNFASETAKKDPLQKEPGKILNTDGSEDFNIEGELTTAEKSNEARITSSMSKLNIAPMLPKLPPIGKVSQSGKYRSRSEMDFFQKKKEDSKSKTQFPPGENAANNIESQEAIPEDNKFRAKATNTNPRNIRKYTQLVTRNREGGDARKEEYATPKDGEFGGIAGKFSEGSGSGEPRLVRNESIFSQRREILSDSASDSSNDRSGCFRKFKKKKGKQGKSPKLERKLDKKCVLM